MGWCNVGQRLVRDGWPLKEICFETLKLDADDVPLGNTTTIYISNTKLPRSDDLRPSGTLARQDAGRSLHSYFRKEIDYSGIASTPKIQRGALGGNSVTSNRLVQPISGLRGCGLG